MLKNWSVSLSHSLSHRSYFSTCTSKRLTNGISRRFLSYNSKKNNKRDSYQSKFSSFFENMSNNEGSDEKSEPKGLANLEDKVVAKGGDNEHEGVSMSSFYSLDKPKDALSGTSQGFGNILKGAVGGAALMISAPIKGAYDGGKESGVLGGLKGFGMGLGAGVLGGAAMAVGGVGTGECFCVFVCRAIL
jgi:hypothetical protein